MNRIMLCFALFACGVTAQSQVMEGTISSTTPSAALPFVNVGIVGKGIGTVSDLQGNFRLDISAAEDQDSLLISYIGYNPRAYKVGDLRQRQTNSLSVTLEQKIFDLEEVKVRPKKLIPVTLGNVFDKPYISAGFESDDLGSEAGTIMRTKSGKKYYLNSAGFFVAFCEYDSILFRMNIYDFKDGKVGENLHRLPIYIKATPESKHIKVDLRPYNISVDNDFVITLEWIDDLPNPQQSFRFCASFMGNGIVWRKTSQAPFEKLAIAGIGLYCEAEYEKLLK